MYTLIRSVPLREFLITQAPALIVSFAIAGSYYKFGSFLWECVAFLATWFVMDFLITLARNYWRDRHNPLPGK
jgi:hypothetical protein